MRYTSKGYFPLNESKKAKDVQVLFLSARAEKTSKSSNSMFFFEDAAKKAGLKMITVDPASASISKISDDKHKIVESGAEKKTIEYSRFCKKMELVEQRERIYYDMRGRIAPSKATYAEYLKNQYKNSK